MLKEVNKFKKVEDITPWDSKRIFFPFMFRTVEWPYSSWAFQIYLWWPCHWTNKRPLHIVSINYAYGFKEKREFAIKHQTSYRESPFWFNFF